MDFLFFFLYAFGAVAIVGDFYTTMLGLEKGLTESNPINRWLFKKIGLTLTAFSEGIAYTAVALALASKNTVAASAYCGIVGAIEAWMYFRNKKFLK